MEYVTSSGHVVLLDDDVALPGNLISVGGHGYAQFWSGNTTTLLHRWLLGLEVGDPRKGDHKNRNPMDNHLSNLRIVDASGSSQNVSGRGKSKHRNVYPMRDKWQVKCKFGGRRQYLGTFDTEDEAAAAAVEFRKSLMPYATD